VLQELFSQTLQHSCSIGETTLGSLFRSTRKSDTEKGAKKYNEISTIALLCSLWLSPCILRGVKLNYFLVNSLSVVLCVLCSQLCGTKKIISLFLTKKKLNPRECKKSEKWKLEWINCRILMHFVCVFVCIAKITIRIATFFFSGVDSYRPLLFGIHVHLEVPFCAISKLIMRRKKYIHSLT
jgi:hypothetical protein